MASYQRQLAAAEKAEEAQRLAAAFREILNVHRTEFPPAVAPVAPAPPMPDARAVRRRQEREALAGIGFFQRAVRAQAKDRAARAADAELAEAGQQVAEQQAGLQRALDRRWQQLCANDPEVVLATWRRPLRTTRRQPPRLPPMVLNWTWSCWRHHLRWFLSGCRIGPRAAT